MAEEVWSVDAVDTWLKEHFPEIPRIVTCCVALCTIAEENRLNSRAYDFRDDPELCSIVTDIRECVQNAKNGTFIEWLYTIGPDHDKQVVESLDRAVQAVAYVMPWLRCAAVTNAVQEGELEFLDWFRRECELPEYWDDAQYKRTRNFQVNNFQDWRWDMAIAEVAGSIQWVAGPQSDARVVQEPARMIVAAAKNLLLKRKRADENEYIKARRANISLTEVTDSTLEAVTPWTPAPDLQQAIDVLEPYGFDAEEAAVAFIRSLDISQKERREHLEAHTGTAWDSHRMKRVTKRVRERVKRLKVPGFPSGTPVIGHRPASGAGVKIQYFAQSQEAKDQVDRQTAPIWTWALEFDTGTGSMMSTLDDLRDSVLEYRRRLFAAPNKDRKKNRGRGGKTGDHAEQI